MLPLLPVMLPEFLPGAGISTNAPSWIVGRWRAEAIADLADDRSDTPAMLCTLGEHVAVLVGGRDGLTLARFLPDNTSNVVS